MFLRRLLNVFPNTSKCFLDLLESGRERALFLLAHSSRGLYPLRRQRHLAQAVEQDDLHLGTSENVRIGYGPVGAGDSPLVEPHFLFERPAQGGDGCDSQPAFSAAASIAAHPER
jgi:hypothetical protein